MVRRKNLAARANTLFGKAVGSRTGAVVGWRRLAGPPLATNGSRAVDPIPPSHNITELLRSWGQGDQSALEHLTPLVYKELHRLARRQMSRENEGHTLQAIWAYEVP
jgi:hypothetical protein